MKIDPQTLVGLSISDALSVLHKNKLSFKYTYKQRRSDRVDSEYMRPDHYYLHIDKNDVVVCAKMG